MGRGRPGGNPDFGKQHKFEPVYDEPLAKKQLQVRLPESIQQRLDQMPTDTRNNLVRGAIASALAGEVGDSEPRSEELNPLVRDAIATSIEIKQAAMRAEMKNKRRDVALVEKWKSEIEQLERLL
jgi:hypothetical protein